MTIYELSTYPFIKLVRENKDASLMDRFAANTLLRHHITNYGLLKEAIESGNVTFNQQYFIEKYLSAMDYLHRQNRRKLTAPLYTFDAYQNSGLPVDILNQTDYATSCEMLPFNSPLSNRKPLGYRLREINIQMAKEMLGTYGSAENNALETCTPGLGHTKSEQVASLIRFYEDQVIRTAEHTDLSTFQGSLLLKDQKEKREMVSGHAKEMCDYLLNEGDTYIFGKLDEEKKKSLRSRIFAPNDTPGLNAYFKFVDMISDYTTVQDLETPLTRKRALDRFIIK